MKNHTFNLDANMVDIFFRPIRDKVDVINILMQAIKIMSIGNLVQANIKATMLLHIDKMSRLFFFTENKKYSIAFPFTVTDEEEILKFSSTFIDEINSKISSDVISIVKCSAGFDSSCMLEFMDNISEYEDSDSAIWSLVKELMLYEDGYIRYDYDKQRYEQAKLSGTPNQHPLNHFDIFYSNRSTFKIGLNSSIDDDFLIELVNTKTDCAFFWDNTNGSH
jgi:hypothetical protein